MYFCMESILKLEEPLLQLKTTDADFSDVPTEEEFVTMSELCKILKVFHLGTAELSAEVTITMHNVLVFLYNLHSVLSNTSDTSKCNYIRAWANHGLLKLDQRIPDCGATNKYFVLGNFFHPKYQGLIARSKNRIEYDKFLEELFAESVGDNQVRQLFCNML